MTRGFFDYEGPDDDEPRTFYERRVAKAKREGTWDKPPPLVSGLPKGAATATAVQSFWMAVTWTTLIVARLVVYLFMIVTDPDAEDWVNAVIALIMGGVAAYYWRSWRILLAHEAEHGKASVHEKADRRTKITALVALTFVGVMLVVVAVVGW